MSVTVKSAKLDHPAWWSTEDDGSHKLGFTVNLEMDMTMPDGSERTVVATFSPGFRCDGLSVPRIFRWFMKSWDANNDLYNFAGAFHDWLYSTSGLYHYFSREECDDIFRGLLRESGKGRGLAGIADKAVELFAGGRAHWGNDSYGVRELVWLTIRSKG